MNSAAERVSRQAVIALGSNLGDSAATLSAAAERLATTTGIKQLTLSSIYTSAPAGITEQPDFKNAVALTETTLSPLELLQALHEIERDFGRVRDESSVPNGPRTLDLDIIDYEGVVQEAPELILPHPRALQRDFVVTPLLELSPFHVLANQKVVNHSTVDCGAILSEDSEPSHEASRRSEAALRSTTGLLSVCATPIGNLGDITLRALETLRAADVIYCEDTRVTRKLSARYNIAAPLRRADAHTLVDQLPAILAELEAGKHLAYVSDAGMPGISDPGGLLVAEARSAGFAVEVLPGASALTTALTASGLKAHNHYFGGFLPRKAGALKRLLEELRSLEDTTLVFYESVHRTAKSLALIAEVLPHRQVVMARELTKLHEEIASGPAPQLAAQMAERIAKGKPLKGEVVLLIGPKICC